MSTTHPARTALFAAFLAFGFGSAGLAAAQTVGRSLVLGSSAGTLAFPDLGGELCRAMPPCSICPPHPPRPLDPALDLMRIPDDDGAGGIGRVKFPNIWQVVGTSAATGVRKVTVAPLDACEKTSFSTACGVFDVKVYWSSEADAGEGRLWLLEGDGRVFGELPLHLRLVARHRDGSPPIELGQDLNLRLSGSWATAPGAGAFVAGDSFLYDSDCDGSPDREAPPTAAGIFLGWRQDGGAAGAEGADGGVSAGAVCALGEDHRADFCWEPARADADGNFY